MKSGQAGRPRTKPPEERQEDILRSAERVFLLKGVEQATIEDITRGADLSKGAFYLHFSSKADVVEAMRGRFVQDLLDRIRSDMDGRPESDWRGRLSTWARACATGYLGASVLHNLIFSAAPAPSREGLTRNGLIDQLTELLQAGNRASAWSVEAPSFTAIFLFNALHGAVGQPGPDNDLLDQLDDHFQRLVR